MRYRFGRDNKGHCTEIGPRYILMAIVVGVHVLTQGTRAIWYKGAILDQVVVRTTPGSTLLILYLCIEKTDSFELTQES